MWAQTFCQEQKQEQEKEEENMIIICHLPVWYFADVSDDHAVMVQLALPSVVYHKEGFISVRVYVLTEV